MKQTRLVLLILLAVVYACGGDGDAPVEPAAPDAPRLEIVGGTFDVTSVSTFDGCDVSFTWGGTREVDIDSTYFSMGPFTGTWDAKQLSAVGETERDITLTRSCTVTRWSTVYITFTSEDTFTGSVIYRLRLAGDCGDRSTCSSSWKLTGTRQTPASPSLSRSGSRSP